MIAYLLSKICFTIYSIAAFFACIIILTMEIKRFYNNDPIILGYYNYNYNYYSMREIEENVYFVLHTKNDNVTSELITLDNINSTSLNPNSTTIVIFHGWNADISWVRDIKDPLLEVNSNSNIIIVDWTYFAWLDIKKAIAASKKIGIYTGILLTKLILEYDISVKDIHAIGHSVGAHICGFLGQEMFSALNKKIGRITGLDAAGPFYEFPFQLSSDNVLSADDAYFVDAIHTCSDFFGVGGKIGHADFYPNGGDSPQPGCGEFGETCSHSRSYVYFIESITSNGFLSLHCKSWKYFESSNCDCADVVPMGYHTPSTARGSYYLRTKDKAPFSTNYIKCKRTLFTLENVTKRDYL